MFRRTHAHHRYRRNPPHPPAASAGAPPRILTPAVLAGPMPEDRGALSFRFPVFEGVMHVKCWIEAEPQPASAASGDGFGPDDRLTLQQASEISGYSVAYLSRLVRDGDIPNAGTPNRPRIFRRDVPIKGGVKRARPVQPSAGDAGPLSDLLREIINRPRRN